MGPGRSSYDTLFSEAGALSSEVCFYGEDHKRRHKVVMVLQATAVWRLALHLYPCYFDIE